MQTLKSSQNAPSASQNQNNSLQLNQLNHTNTPNPTNPARQTSSMAAFVARLMSLSSHELQWLHSDAQLMRHLAETQLLMESRLQQRMLEQQLQFERQMQLIQQQQLIAAKTFSERHQPSQAHLQNNNNNNQWALDLRTSNFDSQQQQAVTAASLLLSFANNSQPTQIDTQANQHQQILQQENHNQQPEAPQALKSGKKYKGEFDEPTVVQIEQRRAQMLNANKNNYHRNINAPLCACVIGSQFADKTTKQVLDMIDKWRDMSAQERVKVKWDVCDLPKDIPLCDIKKFEDLRRQASNHRADFGGASKRKPLGIRGTRQFLLILYCLWGHPGRDDIMQKEGYCPHCFAKIKSANEQSTLVRVVNHFNMKHRRGANPRLSPHDDQRHAPGADINLATALACRFQDTHSGQPQNRSSSTNNSTTSQRSQHNSNQYKRAKISPIVASQTKANHLIKAQPKHLHQNLDRCPSTASTLSTSSSTSTASPSSSTS